jgi:hypothetical protein
MNQIRNKLDEQACGERIHYWLDKYDCILEGVAEITNGSARVRVGIRKLTPEERKAIKEAKKHGQAPVA